MQNPLRREPDERDTEEHVAGRESDAALRLRQTRRGRRHRPVRQAPGRRRQKVPTVAEHLDTARADILAFASFAKHVWMKIWFVNPADPVLALSA